MLSFTNDKDSNRSVTYGYDSLNRITSAATPNTDCSLVTGTSLTKNWGESFTIDAWGNLTAKNVTKCTAESLSVGPATLQNQLPSSSGFGYDAAGDMTSNGSATYTYNGEGQLKTTAGVTYTYDGDGNRVEKSSGTLYWGTGMLESDGSGNLQREFIFAGGKRIARRDLSGGAVYYYFTDDLGSSSVVTNSTGVIQNESDYYPYGGERAYTLTLANQNYKFTGKERDSESGLDMFGARYYGSSLGRFMTPDWAAKPTAVPYAMFGNPQSLNLYSYVGNNPLMHADPDGHCWPAQSCYQAIANAVNNFSNKVFNNSANSSPAVAALKTFGAGVLASTVKMAASPLTMGTATGTCMGGSGCSAGKTALAVGGDVLKGAAIAAPLGALGSKVAGALEGATATTSVTHFTSDAGMAAISESGTLRAGTYVTTPGEIPSGATSGQVESILEIGEGKGANSITFETPNSNLGTPGNGPTTSGGAEQFQLQEPTKINPADFKKTDPQ